MTPNLNLTLLFLCSKQFWEQSYSFYYSKKRLAKVVMMAMAVLVLRLGLAIVAAAV